MIVASPESFRGGRGPNKIPSRRARSDLYPGLIVAPIIGTPIEPNHTVPYGTVPVFARIPGNKLPGYHRSVPPGRALFLSFSAFSFQFCGTNRAP